MYVPGLDSGLVCRLHTAAGLLVVVVLRLSVCTKIIVGSTTCSALSFHGTHVKILGGISPSAGRCAQQQR